ncbi:uncharacterized protein CMU_024080 [Cryptosporidium muris RN66]|uniref:Uncharacterized protein n=1 Tax=Cryptosporidium muris (strain RN66) TaxID=441375 RepID=B6AC50_CRYMR|nr:uncharacterized protein CMU_024080 [Cryptosporidium muris RN66]EEA05403.1 hypothetical protein CMU_024080 [Cryptosporidium muris RN66]|eukprot:XP_002139752.1 hypothetical protein [Cryptosporidium muris RN66]
MSERNKSVLGRYTNADIFEKLFGIDQRFILKALNITCLFLSIVSLIMTIIAYKYEQFLHVKLLAILTILLSVFSVCVMIFIPEFERCLGESGGVGVPPRGTNDVTGSNPSCASSDLLTRRKVQ